MRKSTALLCGVVLWALPTAAVAAPLFEADFAKGAGTQELFDRWTVVDVNGGNTWTFNPDGDPSTVYYNYDGSLPGDDWFISPAITVPSDMVVKVTYTFKGSSYSESFEVWGGNAPTVEAMTRKINEVPEARDTEVTASDILQVEGGQPLHIGFHATTPADRWRLYLVNVSVEECPNPVNLALTELLSPVTGNGLSDAETVKVRVANTGYVDVDHFDISLELNGQKVATETVNQPLAVGQEMEYTCQNTVDLSKGNFKHHLTVRVDATDDVNAADNAIEATITNFGSSTTPYFMGFEADEFTDGIKFFNLNDDSSDWGLTAGSFFGSFARTGAWCMGYNYDKENDADDWAILDPVEVEPGYYVIRYWYSSMGGDHPERVRVCWGAEQTPEAMTNVLADYNPITSPNYAEAIHIVKIDQPGRLALGFYCYSMKDQNWALIDDVSIDRIDEVGTDIVVKSLDYPYDYYRSNHYDQAEYTISNVGITDENVEVTVTVDGDKTFTETVPLSAQQTKAVTLAGCLTGITPGEHTLTVTAVCADDSKPDNNTLTKTFRVLDEPVIAYDFEDGQIPQDFTFSVNDNGQMADPTDYNEWGWRIITFESSAFYGTYALSCNTYLTGTSSADRWVYLPRVTVTADDACMAFDPRSLGLNFPDSYVVRATEAEEPSSWDYDNLLKVNSEVTLRSTTRGVELGKYVGKTIQPAFQVTSRAGDIFVLDNITFHGGVKLAEAGVDEVAADSGADANATYYNIQGIRVEAPLPAGLYIKVVADKASKVLVK